MKVVILAGGLGTRISEYTNAIPKPMIQIGKLPILLHVMNIYIKFGHYDFIIAAGYKRKIIEKYFKNFRKEGKQFNQVIFKKNCNITILETGKNSMTGGRLKRVSNFIEKNENFMFTYGDGLSNVNLKKLEIFHKKHKKRLAIIKHYKPFYFFNFYSILS